MINLKLLCHNQLYNRLIILLSGILNGIIHSLCWRTNTLLLLFSDYTWLFTMSLADELLADLEEDGPLIESDAEAAADDGLSDEMEDVNDVEMGINEASLGVKGVAKLQDSEQV